ncbi:MAG: aldehyde dehydrogenase family protein [Steroidobacteraceae bacterium]
MTSTLDDLVPAGLRRSFYIDGRWRDAIDRSTVPVVNPATEQSIADLPVGTAADVDAAVDAARRAFAEYSAWPVADRVALLGRMHALLRERAELFARALTLEMGVAISFARAAQVPFATEHVRVARDVLAQYPLLEMQGTTAIVREPIGVCALITPWNWPLYQITAKVAPALAAGCTVVLKPSELSPFSALLFAQVVHDAGAPAGVFNLVSGSGPEVGAALASHPDVDMVSITGSTRAGVQVAQAAAVTVKRVTQELGGKSPNVLLPDADLQRAVTNGVLSGMRNSGQSCSAPTRMIVPRARLAEVERIAVQAVAGLVVGDPWNDATTHGPVANRAQFERVQRMIQAGIDEGAQLLCGGPGRPDGLDRGFFVRPTVFSRVHNRMRIAQEEIFGPVLCVIPYDSVDEAVAIANDVEYGLGAHVQSASLEDARRIARRIRAGQVLINYPAWDPFAPFGGYKRSGNGREYGRQGFEEYLETKAIVGYGAP